MADEWFHIKTSYKTLYENREWFHAYFFLLLLLIVGGVLDTNCNLDCSSVLALPDLFGRRFSFKFYGVQKSLCNLERNF